jgi:multiple sugar transport system permease protein
LGLIVGLLIALLMNARVKGMTVFRTIYYLPSVVSGVAVALLWQWVFNPQMGVINGILWLFKIHGPGWIYDENWVIPSFIIMSLWGVGGSMIIYLASLQGVPTDLYEAASIDGADSKRRFFSITIPMITPVLFFNLIMGLIGSFQVFTQGLVMTSGGPNNASLFFVLYLYRNAFQYFKMGYAAAMAWVLFIIIMVLTLLVFRSSSWWVYYESEVKGR